MKALTFFLSLLILVGVNYEAEAQYSRRNYDGGGYASTANPNSRNASKYYNSGDRNMTRQERRRFQNNLVRRADQLDNLERNLQFRSDALDGRGLRRNQGLARSNRPNGLLSIRELRSWEVRLDRKATRLRSFERELLRAERRRGNNRGNRGGGRNGNRNNGGNRGGNGGGTYCPPGWG